MERLTQDQKILYSLADTLEKTRNELDALRLIAIATAATLTAQNGASNAFVAAMNTVIESDVISSLNSPMSDDQLAMRAQRIKQLLPPHVVQQLAL